MLQTTNGKAEILLTPGVFLRLDDNSAVKMISPNLTHTQVELDRGRADIEVDEIHSQNNIEIAEADTNFRLLKDGFYEFDAANDSARVFKGKAEVIENNGDSPKSVEVKSKHQITLAANQQLKPENFDVKSAQDEFYNWSSLRSEYLAEANTNLASEYAGDSGFAPGWYWDTGLWGYTWLPGDGMFWNPFGWGFYSPWYIYGGGPVYYGRGWRHSYAYRGSPGHIEGAPRSGGFQGRTGGFHGGAIAGGGFHGGMGGGFHGGGHR